MIATPASLAASAGEAYRQIAPSYDRAPNPMLSLEQRYLKCLLPSIAGRDVVDVGCGTGRWLALLAPLKPRSLTGLDISPEMLSEAGRKVGSKANLILADYTSLRLPRASADLVFCSFLASYISDLEVLAARLRRLLRPKGIVFLTDLHPVTTTKLGWRRGFQVEESFVDVPTTTHSLGAITSAFAKVGMCISVTLEPEFGRPERELMALAGKPAAFDAAVGHPALLMLQMNVQRSRARVAAKSTERRTLKKLHGARISLGVNESVKVDVSLAGGCIERIGTDHRIAGSALPSTRVRPTLDLAGYLLLPGLINAHDHLEFALYPRLGKGHYRNFIEWADDIHQPQQSPVREHRAVPKAVRLWWGGIRNLLAGVTTVCHHNPYVAKVFDSGFVIRVMRDFAWAHSLQMDQDLPAKHKASRHDQPFIVHLAEGVDAQSAEEIFRLSREAALDSRTVVVHGLGFEKSGLALLNSAGAALIWCPSSNIFLFGRTHDPKTIQSISKAALGSDSPITAQGDLLDEIRCAHEIVGMPCDDLYSLVTSASADILHLQKGEGRIRVGGVADFLAVRDTGLSPAQTLASLSHRYIELVVIDGSVQLASEEIHRRLPRLIAQGLLPLEMEGEVRWIRAPLRRLFADAQRHLGDDVRLGGKRVRYGAAT
jgi:cytosine/adenosine deaminase-related metal-dependent hydrolase/SAM-dependent methyltransferase